LEGGLRDEQEQEEWEPGAALASALEQIPLMPGPAQDGHLAGLRPLLEGALGEIGRLERRRGLSPDERARAEALEELLAASGTNEPSA
jgi:hypothetical protein